MQIANTKDPGIYRTERYDMTGLYKLPNGKYTVKLHFCETYDGITGACSASLFNVAGHDRAISDVWVTCRRRSARLRRNCECGGSPTASLDVNFTPGIQSPEINGIEIISVPERRLILRNRPVHSPRIDKRLCGLKCCRSAGVAQW